MEKALAAVLDSKYDIQQPPLAAGNFFPICGVAKTSLLTIGITESALIVASICWSSDEIDYDVISVTPLPFLTLGVQDEEQNAIFVKAQSKPLQIFQMCSCENEKAVWERFVRVMGNVNNKFDGDGYGPTRLAENVAKITHHFISSTSSRASSIRTSQSDFHNSCASISNSTSMTGTDDNTLLDTRACSLKSATSLPELELPGLHSRFLNRNYNSVGCLNIKFAAAVIDDDEEDETRSKCIGNVSLTDMYMENNSNNFRSKPANESDITITVDDTPADTEDKQCWIVRVFRSIFTCTTRKNT